METAPMLLLLQRAAAPPSGWRRQAVRGQDGRGAPNRVAFRRARQGGGCRDLRAAGLGWFFGGGGDHNNKNHEVDEFAPARLFVGLPIDSVTDGATVNGAAAVAAGIRAVRLLGADGVELPVFWSVAQPESPDRFSWAGYRAVADMVRAEGLSLRVSLRAHGTPGGGVPTLPAWVSGVAADDPDIFFTDRSGARHEGCLSFAIDELPVLHGKSPLQLYEAFFRSFAAAFEDFFDDSTITDVTVGLGVHGVLRYPSYPPGSDAGKFTGVGEFQCYDKYMLAQLRREAEEAGNAMWGLSGPHDAPRYHESPNSCGFFRERGGSWETPYGDFFLSWYAGQLVGHGDRVLGVASAVFGGKPAELSAKIPFMHWWHGAQSRPAEVAAGFYKSNRKNGYSPVAKMFARHGCTMVVPGMDVCMNKQHHSAGSSPDQLLVQIKNACRRHGARIAGENASLVMTHTSSFSRIRSNILTTELMRPCHFTYQRMGADFFSPDHFPHFMEFVRSVVCGEWNEDDGPADEDRAMAAASGSAKAATEA
ncbi:inactive beta-amylase 9-like isoform X2 [Panicum virgatum]|uniref:inactive beta-amylase 9-like isoform X2 n=1 Tax=Panicum virgatum TaxID=38727 RepID=UPI0019D6897B|nr:inactive beta-amylase 9-like isoform X2 [Panicum virgatum]